MSLSKDEITAAAIEQALREVPEPTREQAHDAVRAQIAPLARYWCDDPCCPEIVLHDIRRLEHAARLLRQDEAEIRRLRDALTVIAMNESTPLSAEAAQEFARIAAAALQGSTVNSDCERKINQLLDLINDLGAAISNPTQWDDGIMEQLGTIEGRIAWYQKIGPLRERARMAMSAQDAGSASAMSCTWTERENGAWEADCGPGDPFHLFEFMNYGPRLNGFEYCPYCGAELVEKRAEADEE